MLNKNIPGVKKARPIRKHQLAIIIIHLTKMCDMTDIWWRQRPGQFESSNVRSILYFSEGSVSLTCIRTAMIIIVQPLATSLISYTCMYSIHEHIIYEQNLYVLQFEHDYSLSIGHLLEVTVKLVK